MIRLNETLEDGIYDWARAALPDDINIIWDRPSEDRPAKPYLILNFLTGPIQVDGPELKYKETDVFTYTWRKVITLSVTLVSDNNYMVHMERLLNSLDVETYSLNLKNVGFACWGYEGPWDISELIETKYEFRVNANIMLSYGEEIDYNIGEINSVNLNGNIIDINA